jgi:hypothetical protein
MGLQNPADLVHDLSLPFDRPHTLILVGAVTVTYGLVVFLQQLDRVHGFDLLPFLLSDAYRRRSSKICSPSFGTAARHQ